LRAPRGHERLNSSIRFWGIFDARSDILQATLTTKLMLRKQQRRSPCIQVRSFLTFGQARRSPYCATAALLAAAAASELGEGCSSRRVFRQLSPWCGHLHQQRFRQVMTQSGPEQLQHSPRTRCIESCDPRALRCSGTKKSSPHISRDGSSAVVTEMIDQLYWRVPCPVVARSAR
jgi:hypothetical protein